MTKLKIPMFANRYFSPSVYIYIYISMIHGLYTYMLRSEVCCECVYISRPWKRAINRCRVVQRIDIGRSFCSTSIQTIESCTALVHAASKITIWKNKKLSSLFNPAGLASFLIQNLLLACETCNRQISRKIIIIPSLISRRSVYTYNTQSEKIVVHEDDAK